MSDTLRVEREDRLAVVTIDRPPVNALNSEVLESLATVFGELDEDGSVGAVVLRGEGDRAFVAGADITEFTPLDEEGAAARSRGFHTSLERVAACSKPVVAAIQGFCFGGGLELALSCDLRVAGESSSLGLPEIKLGLLPGGGGTQRLPRLVGPGRARLLYMTGEPVTAATALHWGLVEEVVPDAEVENAARRLAETLAGLSPHALARLKRLALDTADLTLADGLALEAEAFGRAIADPDGREGVAAFLEKRQARWSTARVSGAQA